MAGGDADPDCDKPVCAVKDDMFAMMRRTAKGAAKDAGDNASSSGRGVDGVEGAAGGSASHNQRKVAAQRECARSSLISGTAMKRKEKRAP